MSEIYNEIKSILKDRLFKSMYGVELEKAFHKYVKRTGSPGNYKYWYADAKGNLRQGKEPGKKEEEESVTEKYEDAVIDWASDHNSAIDIWGSDDQKGKLGKIIAAKTHKIKSVIATEDSNRVKKLKKEGWKVFASEDNYDQSETIVIKKK